MGRPRNPDAYFSGKPCKRGHTLRYKNGGGCVKCERERLKDPEVKARKKLAVQKHLAGPNNTVKL